MPDFVTPDYLLKGAAYALEQSGLLLHDANALYRCNRYASAVVMAEFAREALGQWKMLRKLRKEVVEGRQLTVEDVKNECVDHVEKQRAGMLSNTMRTDRDSGLGKLLNSRHQAAPGTPERVSKDEQLEDIDDRLRKRTPADRHGRRMKALYVEPISPTAWNIPSANETQQTAYNEIVDAVNDYHGSLDRYTNPSLYKPDDPEFYEALSKWTDRPTMPSPEQPHFPC